MFAQLEHWDPLEAARATAERRGQAERQQFVPVLEAVEAFAAERRLVVGGAAATFMLTRAGDGPPPLDLYHYELYSPNPVKDGNELARRIYSVEPDGLTQYTVALPSQAVPGQPRTVRVKTYQREVVFVRGLPRHRGVHVFEMLIPEKRRAMFGKAELLCVGPEVRLAETYAALYNPAMAGDWGALLEQEAQLRTAFLKGFERKAAQALRTEAAGGGRPRAELDAERAVAEYVSREGRIIVDAPGTGVRRYACVSVYPLEEEEAAILALGKRAGVNFHVLVNDPQLVNDRRLRRLTAYLQLPGRSRRPVLDVYNSAEYEAVPYLHGGPGGGRGRRGTTFVVLRYLLVEVWTIQLLWRMKAIEEGYARATLGELVSRFRATADAADTESCFPALPDHYLGRIVDLRLAEKRGVAALRAGAPAGTKRPAPFYPGRVAGQN